MCVIHLLLCMGLITSCGCISVTSMCCYLYISSNSVFSSQSRSTKLRMSGLRSSIAWRCYNSSILIYILFTSLAASAKRYYTCFDITYVLYLLLFISQGQMDCVHRSMLIMSTHGRFDSLTMNYCLLCNNFLLCRN